METADLFLFVGMAVEAALAIALILAVAGRRRRSAGPGADELRGQLTAVQEELVSLRAWIRRLEATEQEHAATSAADALAAQRSSKNLASSLGRLDGRMSSLECSLEVGLDRKATDRAAQQQFQRTDHLVRHQVDAMVKLADFLSEMTVGGAQGRAPCLDLERTRVHALPALHRHGLFLPDGLHHRLQVLLEVLLDEGQRFYGWRDGQIVQISDASYFSAGASLPGEVFAAAPPASRRALRVAAAALGLLHAIQGRLLPAEDAERVSPWEGGPDDSWGADPGEPLQPENRLASCAEEREDDIGASRWAMPSS